MRSRSRQRKPFSLHAFPADSPPPGISLEKIAVIDGVLWVTTAGGRQKGVTLSCLIHEHRQKNAIISEDVIWKIVQNFILVVNWLILKNIYTRSPVWITLSNVCIIDGVPWVDSYEPVSSLSESEATTLGQLIEGTIPCRTFSDQDFSWSLGLLLLILCTLTDPQPLISKVKQLAAAYSYVDLSTFSISCYSTYLFEFISLALTCDRSKRPTIGFLGLLAFNPRRSSGIMTCTVEDVSEDRDSYNSPLTYTINHMIYAKSLEGVTCAPIRAALSMHLDGMAAAILQHQTDAFMEYTPWLDDYNVANSAMFLAFKSRNTTLGAYIVKQMTILGHPPPVYPIHMDEVYTMTTPILQIMKSRHETGAAAISGSLLDECIDEVGVKYLNLSALDIAAMYGRHDCVEKLMIEIGFHRDTKITSLMAAASVGNIENTKLLMIEASLQDSSGISALMLAARKGHLEVVRLLKDKESCLMSSTMQTALMLAATDNYLEVVKELAPLEAKITNDTGATALMMAAHQGHDRIVTVLSEYEKGIQNANKQTALICGVIGGKLDNIAILIDEARVHDSESRTALIYAAEKGYSKYVATLFPLEAELVDYNSWTATMHAAGKGQNALLAELIECSCSSKTQHSELNMRDKHGNTALIIAIYLNNMDAIKLLMKHEWQSVTAAGESVFEVAVLSHNKNILQYVFSFYQANALLDALPFSKIFTMSLKHKCIGFASLVLGMFSTGKNFDSNLLLQVIEHGFELDSHSIVYNHFSLKARREAKEVLLCLKHLGDAEHFQVGVEYFLSCSRTHQNAILFGLLSRGMTTELDSLLDQLKTLKGDQFLNSIADCSGRSLIIAAIELDNNVYLFRLLSLLTAPLTTGQGSEMLNHAIRHLSHNSMQVICDYLLEHNIQSSVAFREGFLVPNKTSFIKAITKRDETKLLALRTREISRNHPYNEFNTLWNSETGCRSALMTANSNLITSDVYKYLLCNMGIRSTDNFTALQDSCLLANWNVVKYFTFEQQISGMTWLMIYAAVGNRDQVINHLHLAGRRAGFDYTGLIYAARNGHADCVQLLVDKEAGMVTTTGRTAFFWALANGHDNCAELLYEKEHMICDYQGQTPLMAAAAGGAAKHVQKFVDLGLYVDSVDTRGETALMKAAEANKPECVKILLSHTNDLQKTTPKGMTALMFAAMSNSINCIKDLLPGEAGMQDFRGTTALMYAASNGKLEAVQMLLDHESGMVDSKGMSALFLASFEGHLDCVKLLYAREYAVIVKGSFNIIYELSSHLSVLIDTFSNGEGQYGDYDEITELIPNISGCIEYLLSRHDDAR